MNPVQQQAVLNAVHALFRPGDVVEVRVPKAGRERTISGYFDDLDKMAAAIAGLEAKKYPGIYWTLNPTSRALLSRSANKTKPFAETTTSDADIEVRRWLPIDLDPRRPAGISSTEQEHQASFVLAESVRDILAASGWPAPILADSGNGSHLLYRIDLPNDAETNELFSRVLVALAYQHLNVAVDVDKTTFNPSRIFKAYGTTARKGDSTAERPHRLSRIIQLPAELLPVPIELLRSLAASAPASNKPTSSHPRHSSSYSGGGTEFNIQRWLDDHGLRYRTPVAHEGGRKFVLERCPFDPSHEAPDSAVFERPDGYGFLCFHNSCHGRDWKELRELFEPNRTRQQQQQQPPLHPAPPPPADPPAPAIDDGQGQNFSGPPGAGGMDGGGTETPDLRPFPLTDGGNGERIVALFGRDIRYCVEMQKWLVWDGKRWAVDRMGLMRQKAKTMARVLYLQAITEAEGRRKQLEKHARASEMSFSISNALREAATEPGIPISALELDQQAFLLNCANGILNLATGKLMEHRRELLITKMCAVDYDPAAECWMFLDFLHWAMGAVPDREVSEATARLVGFLQKAFGYSLTGDVATRCVFVCYGEGKNGKSTLLNLFRALLGEDYSSELLIDTVMSKKTQDATARADLADLRGSRFVMTSEVEKEHKLNEGTIKYMTAGMGSQIKSCRKYENPINFFATHKMWMDCNHRPRITGSDKAIWDRMKLVPFGARIAESEKDEQLPEKLRKELPGILAWAVRGCLLWQKDGLGSPPEVLEANQDWKDHDDPLKEFLEDHCNVDSNMFVSVADLAGGYEHWCKQNRERFPLGRTNFNEHLLAKGMKQSRRRMGPEDKQTRCWDGLELKGEVVAVMRRAPSGPTFRPVEDF